MALVAIAVKLESKGPILFRQKRLGFNNDMIDVYKFRSMYTDMTDAQASKLVTKDDPRVTRVGRIIRRTSLDELPQLFNVLTGQMSIVGPRPHAPQAKAGEDLYHDAVRRPLQDVLAKVVHRGRVLAAGDKHIHRGGDLGGQEVDQFVGIRKAGPEENAGQRVAAAGGQGHGDQDRGQRNDALGHGRCAGRSRRRSGPSPERRQAPSVSGHHGW